MHGNAFLEKAWLGLPPAACSEQGPADREGAALRDRFRGGTQRRSLQSHGLAGPWATAVLALTHMARVGLMCTVAVMIPTPAHSGKLARERNGGGCGVHRRTTRCPWGELPAGMALVTEPGEALDSPWELPC